MGACKSKTSSSPKGEKAPAVATRDISLAPGSPKKEDASAQAPAVFATPEALKKAKAAFDKADINKDGFIDTTEIANLLKDKDFVQTPVPPEFLEKALEIIIRFLDQNGDGKVAFDETCNFMRKLEKVLVETPKDPIRFTAALVIMLFDTDGNGSLSQQELAPALTVMLGQEPNAFLIASAYEIADSNHDGKICPEDIVNWMNQMLGPNFAAPGAAQKPLPQLTGKPFATPGLAMAAQYAFSALDKDNDGYVTRDEFERLLQSPQFMQCNVPESVKHKAFDVLLKFIDANSDGKISFTEACDFLHRMEDVVTQQIEDAVLFASALVVALVDVSGDGTLNKTELANVLEVLTGGPPNTFVLMAAYEMADRNDDGKVNAEDLASVLRQIPGMEEQQQQH